MNEKRLIIVLLIVLIILVSGFESIKLYQNYTIKQTIEEIKFEDGYLINNVFYNLQSHFSRDIKKCDILKLKIDDIEKKLKQFEEIEKLKTNNKKTNEINSYLKVDLVNHLIVNKKECNGENFEFGFNTNLSRINFKQQDKEFVSFIFEYYDVENETKIINITN